MRRPFTPLSTSAVEAYVYAQAGARPRDRDAVDTRIVEETRSRTGKMIDSQDEVGGFPQLAENSGAFMDPANPDGDDDKDGYTNLEEKLYELSVALIAP